MVVWASDAEYVLTARQAYELGLQVPTVASPAITMDQVRDLCEPEWVEGWYSVTDFVGNSDDPEVTAFCDKYASDYGEGQKAELYVADVYSTFKLVFDAIERAGSADRQAIRDAVAETKDFPMLQGNATLRREQPAGPLRDCRADQGQCPCDVHHGFRGVIETK